MAKKLSTRQEMLYLSAKKPWEVMIESGEHGRDIVGAYPSWKEAHKALKQWLQDFHKGEINEDDPIDTEEISEEAKLEDQWALKDLKNCPEDVRWTFRFRHDDSQYTVCLQPVGYTDQ